MTGAPAPKTLAEILAYLDASDAGLIATSPEELSAIGHLLTSKVDATREVIDELESQAERLRVAAEKLTKGKRQVLARVERLKQYMAFHMNAFQFTQIPGEAWKVRLTSSESVEPMRDPELSDLEVAPECVRVKYEWNKKALKQALVSEDRWAKTVASLVPSNSVEFDVFKGKLLK
jgi:uncharacterized protein YbgA (DUF1722 family)